MPVRARHAAAAVLFWTLACADNSDEETWLWSDSDVEDPDPWEAGNITIGGLSCPIFETVDEVGFCLEGPSAFASSGEGQCSSVDYDATVWLDDLALDWSGEFTLQNSSTTLEEGEGCVWINEGDQTWASRSGTAALSVSGDIVSIAFTATMEDFLDETDGPEASGVVYCRL